MTTQYTEWPRANNVIVMNPYQLETLSQEAYNPYTAASTTAIQSSTHLPVHASRMSSKSLLTVQLQNRLSPPDFSPPELRTAASSSSRTPSLSSPASSPPAVNTDSTPLQMVTLRQEVDAMDAASLQTGEIVLPPPYRNRTARRESAVPPRQVESNPRTEKATPRSSQDSRR